jgi:arginine repressor
MCSVFNISKSGYYSRFNRLPSKWEKENNELILEIINIHEKSKQTYGSPRITAELKSQDINVSRPRVARLMKKANIRSKIRRKYVVTTDSKHSFEIADNVSYLVPTNKVFQRQLIIFHQLISLKKEKEIFQKI